MKNSKVKRPTEDIEKITALVKNNSDAICMLFIPGTKFDMSTLLTPSVALIESGTISLHRKLDNKLIMQFEPPFPFGITESASSAENYYLMCETESRVTLLDKSTYYSGLKDNEAWMSMLRIVTYLIDVAEEHQRISMLFTSSYDVVKHCINEIWSIPHDEREEVSVYNYIISRHHLSRSSITKIIKSLNDGGYITTKRGVLKKLNHLPVRY